MSLGYIYLCCDDGEFYHTEFVQGDGWAISLTDHDYDNDELWIRRPKENGKTKKVQILDARELISRLGIPIKRLSPHSSVRNSLKEEWQVFAVMEWAGAAFPRQLLPQESKPRQIQDVPIGASGYVCFTDVHRKRLTAARCPPTN